MGPLDLVWLFFILSSLQPMLQQRMLAYRRAQALRQLEQRNGSRAITMIHRREGFAFLGIPFGGFIDIDDSEAVIRAIEMTDDELPIDMVLHTPGGWCWRPSRSLPPWPHIPDGSRCTSRTTR